jgi:hypothetical protein
MEQAMRTEYLSPVKAGDFHIIAEVHSHHVDYKCWRCLQVNEFGVAEYNRQGGHGGDSTTSLAEAEVFLSGSIKWDGCANLHFDAQDECMLHFCGRDDASKVGQLIDLLYDLTEKFLPTYDKELGA